MQSSNLGGLSGDVTISPMRALLLVCLALAGCRAAHPSSIVAKRGPAATLGLTTSAPDETLVQEMQLETNVRVNGRVVETLASSGPADQAGIRPGDVLLQLGPNALYSQDDVDDFLRVSAPGSVVAVRLKRAHTTTEEELRVTLSAGEPLPAGFTWQYASQGQLPLALEHARSAKKNVLVGVSGAET